MPHALPPILLLDAMGVIFQAGDDVAELLVPFVAQHGKGADAAAVERAYLDASLGRITAEAFWTRLGVDPALEDVYLAGHRLIDDTAQLLRRARERFEAVYCLSNDVGQWSRKLRRSFGLEPLVDGWFISGDIGARKPDAAIYEAVLSRTGRGPHEFLFVDDRTRNLDAAKNLGFETLLFAPTASGAPSAHRRSARLTELLD